MRIIAGLARGRRLKVPAGETIRPTADRVREAIFSSLQPTLVGAKVLDLYAGAGGLGLEARSRGARAVTFVEHDRRAISALRENIDRVGLDNCDVRPGEVGIQLRQLARLADQFNLIVADPPYRLENDELETILALVVEVAAPDAIVVIERSTRSGMLRWPAGVQPLRSRRYGETTVHFAQRLSGSPTHEVSDL